MKNLETRCCKAAKIFLEKNYGWDCVDSYFDEDENLGFVCGVKDDYMQITMVRYQFDDYPVELSEKQLQTKRWRKKFEKAMTIFFASGEVSPDKKIVMNTFDLQLNENMPEAAMVRYLNLFE